MLITHFFTGEETIDGVLTEKWKLTQTVGQKVNKYTMWIFYKPDPNNENVKIAVPKRFVLRKTSNFSSFTFRYFQV